MTKTCEQAFQEWRGIRMVDPNIRQAVDAREVFRAGYKAALRQAEVAISNVKKDFVMQATYSEVAGETGSDTWALLKSKVTAAERCLMALRSIDDELISVSGGPPVMRSVYEAMTENE
jgi:predicted TIM-barrel enzyme